VAEPSRPSETQERLLSRLARELAALPGVVAVALGGSHARGSARSESDLDVGVYYRSDSPVSVPAVRELTRRLDPRPAARVTELWEWGPWVNGGAWLEIEGQRVDLVYRELEQLDRTPEALRASVDRVAGLVEDTIERVGPAYRRPAFALES